jgi:hypothetical protein
MLAAHLEGVLDTLALFQDKLTDQDLKLALREWHEVCWEMREGRTPQQHARWADRHLAEQLANLKLHPKGSAKRHLAARVRRCWDWH